MINLQESHQLKSSHSRYFFSPNFLENYQGIKPDTLGSEVYRSTNYSIRKKITALQKCHYKYILHEST